MSAQLLGSMDTSKQPMCQFENHVGDHSGSVEIGIKSLRVRKNLSYTSNHEREMGSNWASSQDLKAHRMWRLLRVVVFPGSHRVKGSYRAE
ncbi:hypothetical protein LguiA_029759 [Lonicera macranthoides]